MRLLAKCLHTSMEMPEEGFPASVQDLTDFYAVHGERLKEMGIILTKLSVSVVLQESGRLMGRPTISAKFTGPSYERFFHRRLSVVGKSNVITIAEAILWFDGRVQLEAPAALAAALGN